ncbi:MAG: glycosyltransferase family 2 protein [Gluconacetobacter diazotrophicus]|nr:glycosyltransferase family 2 protein [Gluconacetobacter diazotrophicus]
MTGCIDIHGFSPTTGGWLLCGWASSSSQRALAGSPAIELEFERGTLSGVAQVVGTLRDDLGDRGFGLMAFLCASGDRDLGALRSAVIGGGIDAVALDATPGTERRGGERLLDSMRAQRPAPGAGDTDRFERLLRRPDFHGQDTIEQLGRQIALRIDEAIPCGDDPGSRGLLLNGWLLAAPNAVRGIRLRSGARTTRFDTREGVPVDRPDVVALHGDALRNHKVGCGFVLVVPDCLDGDEPPYLEVETIRGEVAFTPLAPFHPGGGSGGGLSAIRGVLNNLSPRFDRVQPVFDRLGPALRSLNRARLRDRPAPRELRFGEPPAAPSCSVIVPLYGRIDFMEVQVALFAAGGFRQRHELIYVVDDPANLLSACRLAESLFARFAVPLRLLLLDENLGFAPACNVGLAVAVGEHVCFLNSDVLAPEPDWLDRLLHTLSAHPSVGLLGPMLLFEDDTVQHRGMDYAPLFEFGGWLFPTHPGKGSWPPESRGLVYPPAITGACMLMSRSLAVELGGFDEDYLIGDFEDSDLCLRARARGELCAVDTAVTLYHLERRSQVGAAENWRMNVTLFNAWQHQKIWASTLSGIAAPGHGSAP